MIGQEVYAECEGRGRRAWRLFPSPESPAATSAPPVRMARRQLEMLQLVAQGYSNRDVASQLVISPCTVRSTLFAICTRLGVHTRIEAMLQAHVLGVIDLNETAQCCAERLEAA